MKRKLFVIFTVITMFFTLYFPLLSLAHGDDTSQSYNSAGNGQSTENTTSSSEGTSTGNANSGATSSNNNGSSSSSSNSSSSDNAFTVPGNGSVVDEATSEDGKHFYTIQTEDGNVFYIIVDDQRTDDNVYMTHFVSEEELLSFVEESENSSVATGTGLDESSIFGAQEETTIEEDSTSVIETVKEEKKESLAGPILIGIVIIAGMGVFYYKFGRNGASNGKKNTYRDDFDDDEEEDDYDSDSDDDIAE